jgi:hypothetical protein
MRRVTPRTLRVSGALSASLLVALGFASASLGFPDFSRPYTHDGSSCDGDQDQVDVFIERRFTASIFRRVARSPRWRIAQPLAPVESPDHESRAGASCARLPVLRGACCA